MSQFTASINMFIESAEKENVLAALSNIEEIQEVYELAGECDLVSIVSTSCIEAFRELLHKRILHIKGIKSTIITVVLKLHDKCNPEGILPAQTFPTGKGIKCLAYLHS